MGLRIEKVKLGDKNVEISYVKPSKNEGFDHHSMSCGDKPLSSLPKALQKLAKHVVTICEFEKDEVAKIKVTGVTFKYQGKEETMGATIIAQKKVGTANSPLNISTPTLYVGLDVSKHFLPEGCQKVLQEITEEVKMYLGGKRSQMTMDFDDKKKKEKEKGKGDANEGAADGSWKPTPKPKKKKKK